MNSTQATKSDFRASLDQVQKEVTRLHDFLEEWIRGESLRDLTRVDTEFLDYLHTDFQLIQPSGEIKLRSQLADSLTASYGVNADFKITVSNVETRSSSGLVIATYHESQFAAQSSVKSNNIRISTAIFDSTQTQLKWLHLHETWIPSTEN